MEKEQLLAELTKIKAHYIEKNDMISANQITLAMDVVEDYQPETEEKV